MATKGKPKQPKTTPPQMAAATQKAFQNYLSYLGQLNPGNYGTSWKEMNRLFPQGQLGPTYTPGQMRQQTQQMLGSVFAPRIKNIRDTYQRQGQLAGENVTGYTQAFADRLGGIGPALQQNTQRSLAQQAAIGGGLADYMRSTGASLADTLGQRLAAANLAPGTVAGTVGAAADVGGLASGMLGGLNTATMSGMADTGNAWANWGTALPGIAALQGGQNLRGVQSQLNEGFQQQMGDLNQWMAETGLSLYNSLLDRDLERRGLGLNRSQAMASYLGDSKQRVLNAGLGGSSLLQNWAQMLLDRELGLGEIASQNYGTAAGLWADQNPPLTGTDYPGDIKTKEDLRASMRDNSLTYFNAILADPIRSKNITKDLRKNVMNFLRDENTGPFALSNKELIAMRNRILSLLGYKKGKKGGARGAAPPVQGEVKDELYPGSGLGDWPITNAGGAFNWGTLLPGLWNG